ncbi:MAG TPA: helix-turn-helix domain-containing protein [Solirubrobacterales bacterium]|nr:helix-turn-helix domain-containing protein [Solirubrobacterales bacterium]
MATELKTKGAAVEPAARPLRRDAEENRRRLLEAAREVFAEHGFEATMDQIAARAGVGVGTAYRRFANKDELIGALFQDRIDEVTGVVERALAEEDPWQGVVSYLEGSIELHACDRGLKQLVFSSPRHRQFVDEARAQLKPKVDELVERARAAGVLRPGVETTDLIIVQLMLDAVAEPAVGDTPAAWRRFLPVLLDGLGNNGAEPLAGAALSLDQLDALIEATAAARQRA